MSYRRRIPTFLLRWLRPQGSGIVTLAQWKRYVVMEDIHSIRAVLVENALNFNRQLVRKVVESDTDYPPISGGEAPNLVSTIGDVEMTELVCRRGGNEEILTYAIQYNHVELASWIVTSSNWASFLEWEYTIFVALINDCSMEMLDLIAAKDQRGKPYGPTDWTKMCYSATLSSGITSIEWIVRRVNGRECICAALSDFPVRSYDSRITDDPSSAPILGSILDEYECPLKGCNRREKKLNELGHIICSCLQN